MTNDPRYHDDFVFIKQEIEKLSGADFKAVIERGENFLTTQAKDLRIAGYLTLALAYEKGIDGFIKAITVYIDLIKQHWQVLYPQSPTAKIAAIQWLNQTRLSNALPELVEAEKMELFKNSIDELNSLLKEHAVKIYFADDWFKTRAEKTENPIAKENKTPGILAQLFNKTPAINSESDIEEYARLTITYLREQKAVYRAAFHARAWRWGILELPIYDEKYITRIVPPRETSYVQLQRASEHGDAQALYDLCEVLFLEPSGQWWLDLQYHAFQAANALDNQMLANFLFTQTRCLVERLPLLTELFFSDGKLFASEITRQWLQDKPKEEKTAIPKNKFKLKKSKNLDTVLTQLLEMPVVAPKEQFLKQQAMAQHCMMHQRYDLALPLLERLSNDVDRYHLAEWEPNFAMTVWQDLYQVLSIQLKKSDVMFREQLLQRLEAVRYLICQLDVTQCI